MPASVRKPAGDLAGVAEEADGHPHVARAGRPHEHAGHRRAGQRDRPRRPADVGHDHRRLRGEVLDQPRLDVRRRAPHQVEDAVADRALVGVLDRVHAAVDLPQPVDLVVDVDRQVGEDEAEVVAEVGAARGSSSGRRFSGTSACRRSGSAPAADDAARAARPASAAISTSLTRHAVGARGALDAPQVDRVAPRDAVADAAVALEHVRGLGAGQQQLGQRPDVRQAARRRPPRDGAGPPSPRSQHRAQRGVVRRRRRRCPGPGSPAVGRREHHARERDAVADGVVDARQHGGAGAEALDQVDVPQRAPVVQRRGGQVADELAQRVAVVRRRQRDPVEVRRAGRSAGRPPSAGR